MARYMLESSEVFRTVVQIDNVEDRDGNQRNYTNIYGPYTTAGAARRILSRERGLHGEREEFYPNHNWGTFEGWIEKASISWEKVV